MGGEAASMAPSGWSVSIPSHSVSWWLPLDCRGWSTACGGGPHPCFGTVLVRVSALAKCCTACVTWRHM